MSVTIGSPLDGRVPAGPVADLWERHKFDMKLVNPANRRKYTVIVVGTGLAGASAAATLGELGYAVKAFTILDSPRRSHSASPRAIWTLFSGVRLAISSMVCGPWRPRHALFARRCGRTGSCSSGRSPNRCR